MHRFDMRVEFAGESLHGIGEAEDLTSLPKAVGRCIDVAVQKRLNPKARVAVASAEANQKFEAIIKVMEHSSGTVAYNEKVKIARELGADLPERPKPGRPKKSVKVEKEE